MQNQKTLTWFCHRLFNRDALQKTELKQAHIQEESKMCKNYHAWGRPHAKAAPNRTG